MCKSNEQLERKKKKDVEPVRRNPIVKPGEKGTGILHD